MTTVTRMLSGRRGNVAVILAILLGVVAGCGSGAGSSSGTTGSEEFVFGASLPLTGVYGQYGTITKAGLTVGVDRVNKAGGIDGRQVRLVIKDDASQPDQTLRAVRELVESDRVDFVMPGYISSQELAALPYVTSKKLFTITGASTPALGDPTKYPYQFILGDLSSKRVPAMVSAATRLTSSAGTTKVGIIVSDTPPQVALGDGLQTALPGAGMQVVGYEKVAPDATDLSPQLAKLRGAGAGLVLFDNLGRGAISTIMTGVQTLGWDADVLVGPGMVIGDLKAEVPAAVASQFHAVNYRFATAVGGTVDPATASYVDELAKQGPVTSPTLSATLTDLVFEVKWAYEKAGPNADGPALAAALQTVGGQDYPEAYRLVYDNPGFTPQDHTTNNADYSQFWGLIGAVTPERGIYAGEALELVAQ
ncbi:MAG: ABC transporter substrate-binding protein [Pseudonocardia sp.]|uniref:ABC transporter substrate-binding protein n=2 Tax=Pseudonocardia sp. TaxID=60912 RepID=UPI003D0EF988